MAIYHLHAKILGRSNGRSATAAAAYRAGVCITDERTGVIYDFSRRRHVVWRAIAAPDEAADWVCDRERLWNTVEQAERRRDAQVAREIEVAIPIELSGIDRMRLIAEFVDTEFVASGMVADIAIHNNPGNPHAHILLTLRQLLPDGFGAKVRAWNEKELLVKWRESWARFCNAALERAGIAERIDHRTLIAQGCRRTAERHEGIRRARVMRNLQPRRRQGGKSKRQIKSENRRPQPNEKNTHQSESPHAPFAEVFHVDRTVEFRLDEQDHLTLMMKKLRKRAEECKEEVSREGGDTSVAGAMRRGGRKIL